MVFKDCARLERVRCERILDWIRILVLRPVSGRACDANVINCQICRSGQANDLVLLVEIGRGLFNDDRRRAHGLVRLRQRYFLTRLSIIGKGVLRHVSVRLVLSTISTNTTCVNNLFSRR